ncbi:MAG TPA: alpha/beta fold hydrolase [Planctomycetota bacterium]|nr:alpha/beta fold hydrolase [Planctomycetota bacterium]
MTSPDAVRRSLLACLAASACALPTPAAASEYADALALERVEERAGSGGNRVLVHKHRAIDGLDSPGYVAAGKEYHVSFAVPAAHRDGADAKLPLVLSLHGFGDSWESVIGNAAWFPDSFVLIPNDPLGTWFYGYSDQLPGGDPNRGTVVNYTERRVLAYLAWFLARYPIDPERVFIVGGSMGGTGATMLALRYPELFAGADARKGATNREHCHWRSQCESIWGTVASAVANNEGVNVWDWQNMAWYAQHHHARATWLRTLHGREDTSITYRQVAGPPGVRPMSFYAALERFGIGHHCIWDGSSHGTRPAQPFAAYDHWDPITDPVCFLRRDRSFPAFSACSGNDDPGTGAGDAVGKDTELGDNTYDGTPQGGLNRHLRWSTATIVDEPQRWAIELCLTSGPHGHRGDGGVTVDVTPRRVQRFVVAPGARYDWTSTGGASGEAQADAEGLLTIRGVPVGTTWTTLAVTPRP